MSKKMNAKRVAYAKKQEEEGKRVVKVLIGALLAFAIIMIGIVIYMVQ